MNADFAKPSYKPVIFTGLKNSGKSIITRLFADLRVLSFSDTDILVCEITGMTPRDLVNSLGSAAFTAAEQQACLLALENRSQLIASGGALCQNERAFSLFKKTGFLVYLSVSKELFIRRIFEGAEKEGQFPAFVTCLKPKNRQEIELILTGLYEKRNKKYLNAANHVVETDDKSPEQLYAELCESFSAIAGFPF